MRLLITLFMTMSFSFAAQAKPAAKFEGRILSYQSLMKLTSKKRMQYMHDLAELLAVMEKAQTRFEVADNTAIEDLKEQIAFLMKEMALMPEASAANEVVAAPAGQPYSLVPRWSGSGWTCVGANTAFDPTLGTCALQRRSGLRQTPTFWHSPGTGPKGCPPNLTMAVRQGRNGSPKCIPMEAWEALSADQQFRLKKGNWFPSDFFEGETADSTQHITQGRGEHRPDGSLIRPTGRPGAPDEPVVGGPPVPAPIVAVEPARPTAPVVQCVKPTFNCSSLEDGAKNDLIGKFRRNKASNVCVAGGYFSTYKSDRKQVGTCNLQREFKFASGGSKKCDGPNQAMCNPTVFCLGLKVDDKVRNLMKTDPTVKLTDAIIAKHAVDVEGSPDKLMQVFLCAKVGQDLTDQCNQELDKHIKGEKAVPGMGKGESYVACDAAKVKGVAIQNEWDILRKGVQESYKNWCTNNQAEFTALFCKECQIIAERIMAMNDAATGQPCAAAPAPATAIPPAGGAPETVPEGRGQGAG